jgi:membrane-bound inhibitor of C-type lysozyme
MNAATGWVVAVVVALAAVAFYFWPMITNAPGAQVPAGQQGATTTQNFGTYSYECDEHVAFSMTLSADTNSMQVAPVQGGVFPPAVTLTKTTATSSVRYEGPGLVLTAKGETVTLGEGDSAINCSPVSNPNEAPFNFGN